MAWIEDALKRSHWDIDDLFNFDAGGYVTSCCADFDGDADENMVFIRGRGCNHERGDPIDYEEWKETMMEMYEEQWPDKLEHEAFFRPIEEIPGGENLIERTQARKAKRAKKFHRRHRILTSL